MLPVADNNPATETPEFANTAILLTPATLTVILPLPPTTTLLLPLTMLVPADTVIPVKNAPLPTK